jgi:hypothetical protein
MIGISISIKPDSQVNGGRGGARKTVRAKNFACAQATTATIIMSTPGSPTSSLHSKDKAAKCFKLRLKRLETQTPDITVCTDNTGTICCINGTVSASSQAAFLKFQRTAKQYRGIALIKWVPGHCGIEGNELADKLSKEVVEVQHGLGS